MGTHERIPVQGSKECHRVARIQIDRYELRQLLDLPEGYKVEHIWVEPDPPNICVLVSSPDLAEVPVEAQAPHLASGRWTRLRMIDEHGAAWTRWEWST